MYVRKFIVLCFLAQLLLATQLVGAPADSKIAAVTVYQDRAVVTRSASVDLPVGEQTVAFENLPTTLTDQSLQAFGRGVAAATILDVTAESVFSEGAANPAVKALEDDIKALDKKQRVLDDRARILEEQRGFVQRMLQSSTSPTTGPAPAGAAARPTLEEWQRLYTYAEDNFNKISAEQRSMDNEREEIQAKRTVLDQQLTELRGAQGRRSKTVKVRLSLATAGRLELSLRYAIPNAGWTPTYDARLRSADRAIELAYFGVVRNGTGEDWKNVALTLSTARPGAGGAAPELRPWIASVFVPSSQIYADKDQAQALRERLILAPVDAEFGRGNSQVQIQTRGGMANAAAPRPAPPVPPRPVEVDAALLAAAVDANVTSATFKIPVNVTISGNNISQKVPVYSARLTAEFQFQSTPKILQAAFLSANTSNTSDYPLLAGPMNTYLDDTFVASSNLKTVMPGEKFELAFGVDDGISVKRRLVNRFSEDTGLTNRSRRVTYDLLVTVANNKTTPERVVFKEPTPVSRDEKITVKVITPSEKDIGTTANPKEVTREEDGRLVWRLNLKPGEKREFALKISIEHPADIPVVGVE